MRYFKAQPLENRPYIQWSLVAKDITELEAKGLDDDPLVVSEDVKPDFQYGVCPWKIVDGELVERTSGEMDTIEAEYNARAAMNTQRLQAITVETDSFVYDGRTFPMNQTARMLYAAVHHLGANAKVIDVLGVQYDLFAVNIPAFMTAYYTKLKALTQPPA